MLIYNNVIISIGYVKFFIMILQSILIYKIQMPLTDSLTHHEISKTTEQIAMKFR